METERLRLRIPEAGDRATLRAWFGDPRVMMNLAPVMDEAGADAAIARHDSYRGEGLGFWLVERKVDGAPIGFSGLKRCNPGTPLAGRLETGWMFGVPFWGQGYAGEASRAGIDWAWQHCGGEDRIVAITARVNAASRTLMERIGMRAAPPLDYHSPFLAEGNRLRDSVVYVIDRPT